MKIKGSCVCGAVQFAIDGRPGAMGTCHCSRCRKLGTSTIVFVQREQFHLLRGESQIRTLKPTEQFSYVRSFCGQCGTSLGEPMSPQDSFPINAQCLDDDPGVRNEMHEFVNDKPCWAASLHSEDAA